MPQPRRRPAPARRGAARREAQPPDGAGAAAAAAVAAALAGGAAAGAAPSPPVAGAVEGAAATILAAMDRVFRRRRGDMAEYVERFVREESPGAPESRVQELARREQARELEFQRRSRARLAAQLPVALREPDEAKREERVAAILAREKHYLGQREQAAASRVVAALEQDLLRQLSPQGAYWKLSPLVREHTLDCIAMGEKFWPWEVLDEYHPQLHPGCQCRLLSLDEAVGQGLMTPDQVPDSQDALRRAHALMAEAHRLMESMAPEELADHVADLEDLRLQEAGKRQLIRWAKGTTKGGEFRPRRGGNRGKLSKTAKQLQLGLSPAERSGAGAGRKVFLRGQERFIPDGEHFDERVGGVRFTSPAGGTNIYRDGVLIADEHPDLTGPGDVAPEQRLRNVGRQPAARSGDVPEPPLDLSPEPDRPTALGIPDYTGVELEAGKAAGGSQGAQFMFDAEGRRWLVKAYKGNQDRVATELLSNAIYRELGAPAAEAGTMRLEGEPDFASVPDVPLDEPKWAEFKGKGRGRRSSGVIVREPDGSVWVYEPKGHFGGYEHTFPKGGLEGDLTAQQNALKELWEETGLHATITGYVGDYQGDTGVSRYYVATRTGGTPHEADPTPYVKGGSETAAVKLLSPEAAEEALNRGRDKAILADVLKLPVPEGGQPDEFPANTEGPLALAYPTVDGEVREQAPGGKAKDAWGGPSRSVGDHYMTHAYTANWDFVGLTRDNVLWGEGEDNVAAFMDQGGTLQYRAQGAGKPFGPVPTEVWTLRSAKGQAFGTTLVTESMMREQAEHLGRTMTDERVDELVNQAPFADPVMREDVRQALKDRAQWMREFADGEQQLPQPLDGARARDELTAAQRELEVFPEDYEALEFFANGGYEQVNAHLRSGKPKEATTQQVRDTVTNLDELLKTARLDDDVYGYVAFNPDAAPGGDPAQLVGKRLDFRGYPTAVTRRAALKDAPGILRVTIPAGARAVYVQGIDGLEELPRDVELLMGRGTQTQFVGYEVEDGRPIIDAVVLP